MKKYEVMRVSTLVVALGTPLLALADDPAIPSAVSQITAVSANQAGYGTVMFALALAAVGIMVGVKWIKRARGAA